MTKEQQIEEMAKISCDSNIGGICKFDGKPCDMDCSQGRSITRLYNADYRKASEVASEIFEEIEKVVNSALCVDITDWSAFNELKKKYTEGKE